MPVVRKIRFEIFSHEDIKAAQQDILELRNLNEVRERLQSRRVRNSSGNFLNVGGSNSNIPRTISRKNQNQILGTLEEQFQSGVNPLKDKKSRSAIFATSEFTEMKNKISDLEKGQTALQNLMSKLGLLQGVAGGNILGVASGLAKSFLPIGIIVGIAELVTQRIIASYGDGGKNDIRVKVRQDDLSRFGVQIDTELITGKTYFANAPTLKLTDGRGFTSYTENLIDGARRSRLLNNGYS